MNARAQTLVHVSLEMTRQERDEMVAWLRQTSEAVYRCTPTSIKMLISVLDATEREQSLPISDSSDML
jgi:hypothetical protein